ncbi:hypothetical protein GCM10020001_006320 [Nonomuraea salmonea]
MWGAREVGEGEEAAVALAEGGPAAPAEDGGAQVLGVGHDGVGAEVREIRGALLGGERAHGAAVDAGAAAGAALVEQDDPVVLQRLAEPARRADRAGALAAGAALQEQQAGQVVAVAGGVHQLAGEHLDGGPAGVGPVERDAFDVVAHPHAGDDVGGGDHVCSLLRRSHSGLMRGMAASSVRVYSSWGVAEHLPGVAQLDDASLAHDRDALGDLADDGQVVGDEDVAEAALALQPQQQLDDLGLHRHVERGDGLVADHQLGADGQGAGDADALGLPAGELRGVAQRVVGVEADAFHQLLGVRPPAALGGAALVEQRRVEYAFDGVAGIERGERVLEDDLDVAAEAGQGFALGVGDVLAVELQGAFRRVHEFGDHAGGGGLAAAGLADDGQRLAQAYLEADPVHGGELGFRAERAAGDEPLGEVRGAQQRHVATSSSMRGMLSSSMRV